LRIFRWVCFVHLWLSFLIIILILYHQKSSFCFVIWNNNEQKNRIETAQMNEWMNEKSMLIDLSVIYDNTMYVHTKWIPELLYSACIFLFPCTISLVVLRVVMYEWQRERERKRKRGWEEKWKEWIRITLSNEQQCNYSCILYSQEWWWWLWWWWTKVRRTNTLELYWWDVYIHLVRMQISCLSLFTVYKKEREEIGQTNMRQERKQACILK